uniref:Uncharacterized protein n=1 Tax=Parascaris univalens TaxID=6257 RepID=A0A915AUQ8_PARUN
MKKNMATLGETRSQKKNAEKNINSLSRTRSATMSVVRLQIAMFEHRVEQLYRCGSLRASSKENSPHDLRALQHHRVDVGFDGISADSSSPIP